MADIAPNTELSRRRLKLKKSEMSLQIERLEFRKLEILDETSKLDANIAATRVAIEEIDSELKRV